MACLAGGDDYGWSSNLPWAIAFPHGHPPSTAGYLRQMGDHIAASISDATVMRVQPTMVYEAIGNALIAMWLWRRSHGRYRPWSNISLYFLSYGILRFTLEFLRPKDDRFSFGLTGAQLVSIAFVIIGAIGLQAAKRRPPASVQEQLEEAGGVPAAVRITG
jgi:phosphatidylglycerol:prolipoprotein diacylglycerol transferase